MKRIIYLITLIVLSLVLVSCKTNDGDIEAYAVVHYESNLMGGTTGKVLFGPQFGMTYRDSTVYHINEKKKTKQIQPKKSGNIIFNNNAPWEELGDLN